MKLGIFLLCYEAIYVNTSTKYTWVSRRHILKDTTDSGIDICLYHVTARYNPQYSILFSVPCAMLC